MVAIVVDFIEGIGVVVAVVFLSQPVSRAQMIKTAQPMLLRKLGGWINSQFPSDAGHFAVLVCPDKLELATVLCTQMKGDKRISRDSWV